VLPLRSRAAVALCAAISAGLVACGGGGYRPPGTPPVPPAPAPIVGGGEGGQATADVAGARRVARRFLTGYLAFLYGRGRAAEVRHVSASVRRGLARGRARKTLAQRRRRPRVEELAVIGQASDAVIATAQVDDGGVAPYTLTFTLVKRAGRWIVNSLGSD
jgi:hypothetical protein